MKLSGTIPSPSVSRALRLHVQEATGSRFGCCERPHKSYAAVWLLVLACIVSSVVVAIRDRLAKRILRNLRIALAEQQQAGGAQE